MKEIRLLCDPEVLHVPVCENGESFVDLTTGEYTIHVDRSRKQIGNKTDYYACIRKSLINMLLEAQSGLPNGTKLFIKEGFRPRSLQNTFYEDYLQQVSLSHPDWTAGQLENAVAAYVAPPAVAPHSTGGALDLTLIDINGIELDMGTHFNDDPVRTEYSIYTYAPNISQSAKVNRGLLITNMERAGFVNYPTEWWHWSFGDKYWAFIKKEKAAIYETQETPAFRMVE